MMKLYVVTCSEFDGAVVGVYIDNKDAVKCKYNDNNPHLYFIDEVEIGFESDYVWCVTCFDWIYPLITQTELEAKYIKENSVSDEEVIIEQVKIK